MSAFWKTTGELPFPQLISHGTELLAEMARPDGAPRHVDRDDLPGPEHRVDALTVGDRTRAGEVVLVVDRRQIAFRG